MQSIQKRLLRGADRVEFTSRLRVESTARALTQVPMRELDGGGAFISNSNMLGAERRTPYTDGI